MGIELVLSDGDAEYCFDSIRFMQRIAAAPPKELDRKEYDKRFNFLSQYRHIKTVDSLLGEVKEMVSKYDAYKAGLSSRVSQAP